MESSGCRVFFSLKSFDQLKTEFHLPNYMFFRYLQLRHAFRAQFVGVYAQLQPLDVLVVLKGSDSRNVVHFTRSRILF